MNNSSVWNLLNPLRNGGVSVLTSGQEMFGTVIKHDFIKVRVHYKFWNHMYRKYFGRSANYLVHDEENFCRVGDKVVIKSCGGQVSSQKSYYVRNVVKQFPRNDYLVVNPETTIETKTEFHELYKNFLSEQITKKKDMEKQKEEVRAKALEEAMEKFKMFKAMDEKTQREFRKRNKEINQSVAAEKLKSKPKSRSKSKSEKNKEKK